MNATTATTERSLQRIAVELVVWLLLAALLVETWLAKGIVPPCRVVGGSMAESLLGCHRNVVCADCGYTFSCGVDQTFISSRAACPNCGYADNDLETMPDIEGERLLINRAAFLTSRSRRWEVAALLQPSQTDKIVVKRIVGLPGETVEIIGGDVYINEHIQRKNLKEQRAMIVPVHAAAYRPTLDPALPPRWRPESEKSRWKFAEGRYSHSAGVEHEGIDWLVYHHGYRVVPGSTRFVESPVRDLYGYNQSRPRRDEDVHAVADLMLSFWMARESDRGTLHIRATDGVEAFEARLRFGGKRLHYEVLRDGHPISGDSSPLKKSVLGNSGATAGLSSSAGDVIRINTAGKASSGTLSQQAASGDLFVKGNRNLVEVSLIDSQFLLAIDGRTAFSLTFKRSDPPASPTSTPFAIGVQGLAMSIDHLRIYRDVYYTKPIGLPPHGSVQLAADEYYVLGDNSPASRDSRHWPDGGAVKANLLLGKVLHNRRIEGWGATRR